MLYLTIISCLLVSSVVSLDLKVDICGFPQNVTKCGLIDIPCINKLEYAARVFFNSPAAKNYILEHIDPMSIDKIEFYAYPFMVTLKDIKVEGIINSHHEASLVPDGTLGEDYWHSGTLNAKYLKMYNILENYVEVSETNVEINFSNLHTKSSIAIEPVKRCKEDIFFNFMGTGINFEGGDCEFTQDASNKNYKDISTELCQEIAHAITEKLQQNLRLVHVSVAADRLWVFEPASILKPEGDSSNSDGFVSKFGEPLLEH